MVAAQESMKAARFDFLTDFYAKRRVVVTGGASFIGSHLVEALVKMGSRVLVVDDFSSGKSLNLEYVRAKIEVHEGDLRSSAVAQKVVESADLVFHLAAVHGGRGFIESFQREMLDNLTIDGNVFSASNRAGVKMIVHASSACAYPTDLQNSEELRLLLREDQASMVGAERLAHADGVYGWTKLIGEYQLMTWCDELTRGRSARIFTAYGERENESHAAIALISKALLKIDPFPIWGSGNQTRNFTYVGDTVAGLLLLGADTRPNVFDVVNIGTDTHVPVIDFVECIFQTINWQPKSFDFQLVKPVGVASRASDNSKIQSLFAWCPKVSINHGLSRTITWYSSLDGRPRTATELESLLVAR